MNAANLTLYEGYMYTYSYFGVFKIDYYIGSTVTQECTDFIEL